MRNNKIKTPCFLKKNEGAFLLLVLGLVALNIILFEVATRNIESLLKDTDHISKNIRMNFFLENLKSELSIPDACGESLSSQSIGLFLEEGEDIPLSFLKRSDGDYLIDLSEDNFFQDKEDKWDFYPYISKITLKKMSNVESFPDLGLEKFLQRKIVLSMSLPQKGKDIPIEREISPILLKIKTIEKDSSNKKTAEILSCALKTDKNVLFATCPHTKGIRGFQAEANPPSPSSGEVICTP